jgi:hypothetical protein
MMIEEMTHMISKRPGDPIGILIIASLVRDDFPWLYEIALEAYRATKGRSIACARDALRTFRDATEMTLRGPFAELGIIDKESHMHIRELPMIIDHFVDQVESCLPNPAEKHRSTNPI